MTFVRRTAALLLTAAALTGCGHILATPGDAAPPAAPSAPGTEQGGDANPHYAENHAFQSTLDLSEADRVRGEAEVKRVKRGLAALAEGQKSTEDSVFHALHALGYPDGSVTTSTFGPHRTSFTVTLGTLCVDGSLDGVVNGLVNAEAHGRYMEGTGCVKPRGGH
ncbi:hypothetical protein [Streptomyces sp. CB02460]|uniref:hypothetical protein n=1 Tax=Streptomyces sp. CB02460 TaxID=1703941 RepID=UPI000A5A0ACE|nr:hypothetical protein [Streptomyces sp. CB02460]